MIKPSTEGDREAIESILVESGMFDPTSVEYVMSVFDDHIANGSSALWRTAHDGDVQAGVAYVNPEPVTIGTWNLLMIWIKAGHEGRGFGSALIREIEDSIKQRGARLLIVETSGTDDFATARAFYERNGFVLEARVKDFYSDGEDKLVYTKRIQ
jgi:ribosomal protein S18 acetylase RimI-like enzyme